MHAPRAGFGDNPFDLRTVSLTRRLFLARFLGSLPLLSAAPAGLPLREVLGQETRPGVPLRLPPVWTGDTLTVAPTNLAVWPGSSTAVFAINGSVPGPTIRIQRGREFDARVLNQLPEPLVLHWHGLLAPERMDGHPRDAVGPGQSYRARFQVNQRAATCWYHAHTDGLTAAQVYKGVAGLFLIEDPAESGLGLPAGDHDLPLVIADRRSNAQQQFTYAPTMMDVMGGYLGDVVLVNGTPDAWLSVDQGLYRFRLLNGSNARVFRIGFADSHPFHLIATDGGLLPAPVEVTSAMLAPGQRLEILVAFDSHPTGSSVVLKSLSFPGSGGMTMGARQGTEMDLLRFCVDRATTGTVTLPTTLMPFSAYDRAKVKRTRTFTLAMSGMRHTINGRFYDPQRTDFSAPFGDLELWEYRNSGTEPHPMHLHAAHFQVAERLGQAQLPPEDTGWKDTVLVNAGETVRVLVQFDAHPGLFVQHCHNLEHEDGGMMQNFEVIAPPVLTIEREPGRVVLSWPVTITGYLVESAPRVDSLARWESLGVVPEVIGGRWQMSLAEPDGAQFYRLAKRIE